MYHNDNLGPIASDITFLQSNLSAHSENLNIGHVNAQSLNPSVSNTKFEEFKNIFMHSCLDIIGISESWFKSNIYSQSITLPGYNLVRNDRPDEDRAGGVCLYISEKLRYRVLFHSDRYRACESLFVEVFGNGASAVVGVVYLPNGDIDLFEELHRDLFDRFSNIVVMGDFNCNLFNVSMSERVRALSSRSGLTCLHNCLPTHLCVRYNSTSLIDYFMLSQPFLVACKGQLMLPFFSSYHSLIYISLSFSPEVNSSDIELKDYKLINYDQVGQYMDQFDSTPIFCTNDVDVQLSILNDLVNDLHDFVPTFNTKTDSNDINWMKSREIVQARVLRDSSYRTYLRDRTDDNWRHYCKLRNKAKSVIRRVRRNYGKNLFSNVNNAQLWSNVRRLGCVGRETPQLDETLVESIANGFLNNLNPNNLGKYNFENFVDGPNCFSFNTITEYDVLVAINSIKSNAVGYDMIPVKFLKIIFPLISALLCHIINTMFTVAKFPRAWKLGRIVPIAKNKSANYNVDNLRPISILPAMSKIVENVMKSQILYHCERYSLFHMSQYAFRRNHNTTSLLISLTDSIRQKLNKHENCILVSLDLTKAFDRINHNVLIKKLQNNFNFSKSACQLIYSYLSGRSQFVSLGGLSSSVGDVTSGVPQGSVLGPILFLAYLNDCITLIENNFCKPYVFADDIFLVYNVASEIDTTFEIRLNNHLTAVNNWMHLNDLEINSTKTKAIYFHLHTQHLIYPRISINNQIISYVDSLKCLGVVVDSNLNFGNHVNTLSNQVSFILRRLYALKSYTPRFVRYRLAHALLMSKINYCLEVFSGTLSGNIDYIEKIVRRVVRYVYNIRVYDHERVSELVPEFLGCKFHDYLNLRLLLLFYKIMKLRQPISIVDDFVFIHSTRNIQIEIPRIHLSIFARSFKIRVCRIWNHLPSTLRRFSYSHFSFKIMLLSFFSESV